MEIQTKKLLLDILDSINSIYSYLGKERNFLDYRNNKMLRRAIEREFEIIGEALNKIIKIDGEIKISNKSLIVGMRNRVIHGYDKVDDEIVWGAILRHLPTLKREIEELLNQN
ncbi:Uncharacterized conserved protein, contains HEPN domain [Aquiflexum balticum DSM 16537]|uniref:Uncharacterized conserved protein, contains HEPN domain n=1 Tax=Aquiflexum balticum DSM 16537 TaxID=758820 RepID=A0A1W2H5P8_9BACT|nr:HepT-like ribonuclease domain-containing protein [Aquiflexum balticum]SMD44270.1 Uncharacterized conserved protein, contains HEPN domain [Aquiflexum balticum DSM 16537]